MTKRQSPKPQSKGGKQKKGGKLAEAPEVQALEATEPPVQPESLATGETPREAAAPPAPEQPTPEPPAPAPTPAEATTPVEVAPESAASDAAAPAKTTARKAAKEPKPKKTSALDAAAKVLAESGEAMTTQAMIEAMATKGYWSSPGGATPQLLFTAPYSES